MLNASHLARVDINLLVLFHVVLEEGNVGRAADRLRLTSSAVSHGLARLRRMLDEANFCAANHLLVSSSADPQGFVDEALRKRGRKRRVALTVPSFMLALEHVAHSDLLAALPRQLVRRHAARFRLAAVELPLKRKPDPIQAVTTKAALLDAGIAWLIGTLVDLFAPRR